MRSAVELASLFRAHGLKATPQRLTIYRALAETLEHPSAETLFQRVRPGMPGLSLATVYKALEVLEHAGLVRRLSGVGEVARFDAKREPHHHLVCTGCEAIFDTDLPILPEPPKVGAFEVTGVHVQFLGLCGDCVSQEDR